ncbi:oligoendopeptidase F2 [Ligilactobacillus hayakitensis DSM 18933 = JCM 14209]|uniref:Oligoendopeptidase F2 n=1 Tax=Ligilactobacillus hayakitensis DSM 18933 = JCM 14209 TaxID=1423755 RepID=A0A0R1WYA5_9LACO|nr:M3 family oligoendopeptidase [Ligilactobacillus hayakitensis]KRM19795.1 oligoendopeptidase F2 [Ligilactobacillus hayakitensis DSM 18933 = JCM 14209]
MKEYSEVWDLESIFAGGSNSAAFQERLEKLKVEIKELEEKISTWQADAAGLKEILAVMTKVDEGLSQLGAFAEALSSADVTDSQALQLDSQVMALIPEYSQVNKEFQRSLAQIPDEKWESLLEDSDLKSVAFVLGEFRRDGANFLSAAEENIIAQLKLDGQTAWSRHYDVLSGNLKVEHDNKQLSAGQAFNLMMASKDNEVRDQLFEKWEEAWGKDEQLYADTLNHIDGARLTDQKLHGNTDYLKEPREYNRLKQETLDQMWAVVAKNKQSFVEYMNRKAQLLGRQKPVWQDQEAPVVLGDFEAKHYTFSQAAEFIMENFEKFSPKMAALAKKAFEGQWIEAQDRPNKRAGGYCTGFPENQESRIFMTFGGSVNEVATLAHELGHAFHSSVMWDLPHLNQGYAMNVAETASTFAEQVVNDAAIASVTSKEEKINLLDQKLQGALAMFFNIHARYIFERSFYEARQTKVLSPKEISDLMVKAQKEAFADSLANWHPHFWAAKLHFYIDDVPFYNFPYTFGYLFSQGIYAQAKKVGGSFEDQYIALLRDTGAMTTEELAQKHLGVDLTKADFWQAGIDTILEDVKEFMELTEEYVK